LVFEEWFYGSSNMNFKFQISNDTSSLVWTLPTSLSDKLVQTTPAKFVLAINTAFQNPWPDVQYILRNLDNLMDEEIHQEISWGLDRVRDNKDIVRVNVPSVIDIVGTSRGAFPLKLRHATNYIDNRIALVGDAAHSIHPLAGQGLNLGLADAKALTSTISKAASSGSDIGSVIALEPYFRDRFGPNAVMLQACDTIQKVFGSHYATSDKVLEMENGGAWGMMVGLRSLVMKSVNSVGPLRDVIMKYAMS
jgi:ubiquinone biosynthesis monooxygenase Coq6